MPSPTTTPYRRLSIGVAAAVALATVVAVAPTVTAEPGLTIAEVEAQIEQLHTEAEMVAEELNGARVRLAEIREKQDASRARVARAKKALSDQARDLGQMASLAYRSGSLDASVQLLMAENPADFLQQSAALDIVAKGQNAVLRRTSAARLEYVQATTVLDQQEAEAQQVERDIAEKKAIVEANLVEQQRVLSQLKEEERRRLEAERKAREEAARKAAARAAAAAEEAARLARERAASAANNNDTTVGAPRSSSEDTTAGPDDSGTDTVDVGAGSGQDSGFVGSDQASIAVAAALAQVGEPYTYDAVPPDTWDCSKLTAWAWGQAGVSLTPYSYTQATEVRRISTDELRPGDLLFYFNGAHHVSMYIGDGMIVEAANPSSGVRVTEIWNSWTQRTFSFAGRPVG